MHDTVETRPALAQLQGLTRLMRPKQWVKNGFVLAPLFFSGEFLDADAVSRALLATVLFCIASSATYIVNDMHDIERDRRHPVEVQHSSARLGHRLDTRGVAPAGGAVCVS